MNGFGISLDAIRTRDSDCEDGRYKVLSELKFGAGLRGPLEPEITLGFFTANASSER